MEKIEKMNINKIIEKYIETLTEEERKNIYISKFSFGDENDIQMQNYLAQLVLKGEKTATTSLYSLYDFENERIPQVGDVNVILDGNSNEVCVTVNTKVYRLPFKDISEEYAYKEGEGDKSLEYWKKVHKDFFIKEAEGNFNESMEVLCEEFELLK
ncbi:ASCH domain protein [Pseudoleptotrichia goodfellowii F0264]|uniref:ASCH domain protein n=2 Tax=Pseudoleptotrichia goodfellowii TaxID=157692 RepID=D0GM54_9FUSO|nr:ASCH domain protein [Pseudoleptotrichia goodfellowii F0264]